MDAALDSRGWAEYRMGQFQKSLVDFESDLQRSTSAWSLYGRGLIRIRSRMQDVGERDIAIATGLNPKIVEDAKRYGFVSSN